MKQTLLILTLLSPAAFSTPLYFSCTNEGAATQIVHYEMHLAEGDKKCSAIAMDSRGGQLGHSYNSTWGCEVQDLVKGSDFSHATVQLKIRKAKGMGPEGKRLQQVNVVLDLISRNGGGLSLNVDGEQAYLRCEPQNGPPPLIEDL